MSTIAENIANIRAQMADAAKKAGRDPSEILLCAATKMNDKSSLFSANSAGSSSDVEDEGKELSVPDPEPLPEERVIFNEKQEAIRAAMNALPVDFREILELRVVQQLPYEQIAQIIDLPVGTVKSRLARARLQLKKRLDAGNFFETGTSKHSE